MKPAAFDYVTPRTVAEAVAALADTDRKAQVLAGGQSLLIEMHYRRARPDLVVDINRVADLDALRVGDGALRVGALVRHRVFESPRAAPGPLGRLLSLAAHHIAHPPIRTLGTMVGSLAWAHPASEWCTVAVALGADIEVRGGDGDRSLGAHDYFRGPHLTTREPGQLITGVRLPLLEQNTGVGFLEHRRTHASFAQIAVVATLTVHDGVITGARIGLANAADRPVRAVAAETSLIGAEFDQVESEGQRADAGPFHRAAGLAAERDASPRAQPYADVDYQRHVVAVLVRRTLHQAAADLRADAGRGDSGDAG
ncbi:FAD binding domain-containing protein [Actinopolymorpha pittospori]|uniref:Carbon-monoxide dehydrogenase medium subunit n=1 Tax=Actinopolymorpha pittospori TaxID=648752 RepID=A0A927RBY8_9ACTN|nr:carbon-monoxide dehydrogenase medium subunit [Actinopolymorpha pittospori]